MTTFANGDLREIPSKHDTSTEDQRHEALQLQPPFDRSASITSNEEPAVKPQSLENLLPAAFYDRESCSFRSPEEDLAAFLALDMEPSRLDSIHHRLWITGRPSHSYSLHQQHMIGRSVTLTERPDMHLVWIKQNIYLKAFPRYLCDHAIWIDHLCDDKTLHAAACGFILSYTWLICSELDFSYAQSLKLVPDAPWTRWRALLQSARLHFAMHPPDLIHRRYIYSELRLSRLNWIFRFDPTARRQDGLRRALFVDDHTYSFFQRNFAWTIIVFLYVTLALTSMQVGLAMARLQSSGAFPATCYGSSVFCLVLPVAITFCAAIIFICLYTYNVIKTLLSRKKRRMTDART